MRSKLVLAGLAAAVVAGFASSSIATADDGGAIVVKGDKCGILVNNGITAVVFEVNRVITPSGNRTLVCNVDLPAGAAPADTIVAENIPCGIKGANGEPNVVATDSHTVITKSGRANLTCHFKAS